MITNKETGELTVGLSEEAQEFITDARRRGMTITAELQDDQSKVKLKADRKFRTTNYSLAAFLVLKGFQLQEIVFDIPFIPQKGVFVFEICPEIEEADQAFMRNETDVSVQDFIRETNKLKHMLDDKMNRRGVYKYGQRKNRE